MKVLKICIRFRVLHESVGVNVTQAKLFLRVGCETTASLENTIFG